VSCNEGEKALEMYVSKALLYRIHGIIDTRKENIMTTLLIFLAALLMLDWLALRWGLDSRDNIESAEWPRRLAWKAFQ
jgi:hypothetical protein